MTSRREGPWVDGACHASLGWLEPATGYNLVAIPIAMGVLVPWGIDLPMAVGAVAMSLSTIIVAANAQLHRRVRLRRDAPFTNTTG